MRKLVFLLTLLLVGWVNAADISPVLVPRDNTVSPGAPAQFTLVYLNASSAPVHVQYPSQMTVTLESSGQARETTMFAITQLAAETIQPGRFGHAIYQLNIPADLEGNVIVKLKGMSTAPVVVAVSPAPIRSPDAEPLAAQIPATHAAATQTVASSAANQPLPASHQWSGDPMTETFLGRFSTYQPMYFVAGSRPTAKFQFSFKYKIFDEDGPLAEKYSFLDHLYGAYTQTSFWDVASPNPRFTSNSYQPELMFSYDDILKNDSQLWDLSKLGLQGGYEHESNGTGGTAERSMNILYLRPIFVWDLNKDNGLFISLAPRAYVYLTTGDYDHDISQYRGYGDVRLVVGQRYGFQAALFGRVGEDFNKGSLELDLSEPLRQWTADNLDLYLYAQFFTGYGDQLSFYNKSTTTFRMGVAFVR